MREIKISIISLLILVGCAASIAAEELPKELIEKYAAYSRKERWLALNAAVKAKDEKRIADLENLLKPYYGRADVGNYREHPDAEQICEALKGKIGVIPDFTVHKVQQVVSPTEMIVDYKTTGGTVIPRPAAFGGSRQTAFRSEQLYIDGATTKGLHNDQTNALVPGFLAKVSTRTYQTLAGSNTLVSLEKVDLGKHKELFTMKDEARTWTSAGGHKIEAILVKLERKQVHLMNLSGKVIAVDIGKLSDEDVKFARKEMAARRKPKF